MDLRPKRTVPGGERSAQVSGTLDGDRTGAPATRAAIVADAATALQPYIDPMGLAFPLHTNIVLCRRLSG